MTPPPQPAAESPPPKLGEWLTSAQGADSTDEAFTQLFTVWGATYDPGYDDPCLQATDNGLECLAQRGSWAQLRALNRPAILTLADENGVEHRLLITRLDDERATARYAGRTLELGIAEISRYWFGDFVVLWRPRVVGAQSLSMGMQGEAVRWLRQSLAQARGGTATSDSDTFDFELVKAVEDFQRDHRLTVDGIAGKQTQMMLDSALAKPDTPLLTPPASPAPVGGG